MPACLQPALRDSGITATLKQQLGSTDDARVTDAIRGCLLNMGELRDEAAEKVTVLNGVQPDSDCTGSLDKGIATTFLSWLCVTQFPLHVMVPLNCCGLLNSCFQFGVRLFPVLSFMALLRRQPSPAVFSTHHPVHQRLSSRDLLAGAWTCS